MNHVVLCLEQPPLYGNGLRCYRNLSEGQRAKLGLRIGRRFKTLGGVEIVQIDKVWEIIGNLGLTQSYKLWRSSDRVSERDFPTDSPAQTFYLYVTFKRSYSDDTPPGPATLTAEELGELAQGIGEDLDILRSLDKDQILNVLNRIYESRYLHGYQIWSDQEIVNIDLDALMTGPDEHLLPINFEDFLLFDGLEMESGHQNTLMTPNNAIHPGNPPEVAENGMVTSPVSTSTETDVDSAYPTPSSDGLDSPRPRGKPTRTNSPRTPNHGRANSRNIRSQRKGTGAGIKLNPIAKTLLKGNNPKLKDIDITKILAVDACILPPDFQTLRSLSDQWHNNESQGQHALGLPKEWIGIHAAWNYLKELEAETLEPVAENVAYLLFHFNYKELCKFAEHYCGRPLREKERADSCVYDCIIEAAYLDDWTRNLEGHELRKKIGNHIRKAKWCWEVVANLGAGVLLKGGWVAKCYNESLSNARANALVTYILNTRPGTARLFRSLEPTMKTLMSGRLPDLIKTVRAGGTGLQDQLYTLSVEDEKALVSQSPENRWALIDVTQIAEERVSDFLYSPELCSFANIYTC